MIMQECMRSCSLRLNCASANLLHVRLTTPDRRIATETARVREGRITIETWNLKE